MKRNIYAIKPGKNQGNCYLIKNCTSNILIITGSKINIKNIERSLSKLITNRNIDLIILTQFCGFRHNNLLELKRKYKSKLAMHKIDYMVPLDNKSWIKRLRSFLYISCNRQELKPDLIIDEGYSLKEFGINARIINMSGYANDTIGVLTDEGELFCDNIFNNTNNLSSSRMIVEKFKRLLIDIVYPQQGNPILLN